MKEEQLREDQRREALARLAETSAEETLPPPAPVEQPEPVRAEPRPEPREEARPEPRHEPRAETHAQAPQPKIDSKVLLESAGLVMIETDRAKAPAPVQSEEPQHLGRPRRERAKPQAQDDDLQQVETKR